eukprot:scaffold1728_cov116-Isochrysis_galbana.AAC.1
MSASRGAHGVCPPSARRSVRPSRVAPRQRKGQCVTAHTALSCCGRRGRSDGIGDQPPARNRCRAVPRTCIAGHDNVCGGVLGISHTVRVAIICYCRPVVQAMAGGVGVELSLVKS